MSASLVVLVPSRGRPAAARALVAAFRATSTGDTELTFVVDEDDPACEEYAAIVRETPLAPVSVGYARNPAGTMVGALNEAAEAFATRFRPAPFAVGFMGDDHRPRTAGWDTMYLEALHELGTGIVYGDDGYQGANLPTQAAMTADIVRALGYMAPPSLRHMYVDNFWRDLGRTAGCLRYLPDVLVEHLHPVAGKAEWDAGYLRVNDGAVYDADAAAYARHPVLADAAKVMALRGGAR